MVQHYFLSAIVPEPNQSYRYFTNAMGNDVYTVGFQSQPVQIQPGQSQTLAIKLYAGPEKADLLKKVAPKS